MVTAVVARVCLGHASQPQVAVKKSPWSPGARACVTRLWPDPEHEALLENRSVCAFGVLETLPPASGSRSCCTTFSICLLTDRFDCGTTLRGETTCKRGERG